MIAVLGAPVFTFHVEGHCALLDPGGPAIWQVTTDPAAAAGAGAGTAILGSVRAALGGLLAAVPIVIPADAAAADAHHTAVE